MKSTKKFHHSLNNIETGFNFKPYFISAITVPDSQDSVLSPENASHRKSHGSHQKNWFKFKDVPELFKFQDFPGLSRTFFHFFQDFLHQSFRALPELSIKFQDFSGLLRSCTNSSNKISFFQNKNIHLVIDMNNSSFYSKSKNKYLS